MRKILEWFEPIIDAVKYAMEKVWSGVIMLLKSAWVAAKSLWEGFSSWLPDIRENVIRLIKGDYSSIEGEVKFSDYVPKDGSNELLSLGWIVRTGERADINPKGIDLSEIKLLD
jgi:hypothetical protein